MPISFKPFYLLIGRGGKKYSSNSSSRTMPVHLPTFRLLSLVAKTNNNNNKNQINHTIIKGFTENPGLQTSLRYGVLSINSCSLPHSKTSSSTAFCLLSFYPFEPQFSYINLIFILWYLPDLLTTSSCNAEDSLSSPWHSGRAQHRSNLPPLGNTTVSLDFMLSMFSHHSVLSPAKAPSPLHHLQMMKVLQAQIWVLTFHPYVLIHSKAHALVRFCPALLTQELTALQCTNTWSIPIWTRINQQLTTALHRGCLQLCTTLPPY